MEKDSLIYILDTNQNSIDVLQSYLNEEGYTNIKIFTDYEKALESLKEEQEDKFVFIDLLGFGFILTTVFLLSKKS